ncbi:MAG: trypsin-like peptidase domain-containing protein [Dongiaceae bacterium]
MRLTIVTLILLLVSAVPALADVAAGDRAYANGDYQTAFHEWEPAARDGDSDAQYGLGLLYEFGLSVQQDYRRAALWYERAVDQGHIPAHYALGYLYEIGEGVKQNYREAERLYRVAADGGDLDALVGLGYLYENGLGVTRDYERAYEYYLEASRGDSTDGMFHLAQLYAAGFGVARDISFAYALFGIVAAREPEGSEYRNAAIDERTRLRASMSAEDIAAADAMAVNITDNIETPSAAASAMESPIPNSVVGPVKTPGVGGDRTTSETTYYQGEEVLWVQQALAILGYDAGTADGAFGPHTQSAIREFQRDVGMPEDGAISEDLLEALESILTDYAALTEEPAVKAMPEAEEPEAPGVDVAVGSGTGMLLNARGNVLTNNHVIAECSRVTVRFAGEPAADAALIASDPGNDLAVLRAATPLEERPFVRFRDGRSVRLAEEVIAIGYPLAGLLSSQVKVTTGTVNGLAGLYDDTRYLQISVPVQPGNSGGPLVDMSGNVVGVITGKLDALAIAEATGDIPQNINFAIKTMVARNFLDANDIAYELAPSETMLTAADVAEQARHYTVLIECFD